MPASIYTIYIVLTGHIPIPLRKQMAMPIGAFDTPRREHSNRRPVLKLTGFLSPLPMPNCQASRSDPSTESRE